MDFNQEAAREELENFENEANNVSPLLERYLQIVAKTGNILFPWCKLQPLLKKKLEMVLSEFTKVCPPDSISPIPNTDTFDFDVLRNSLLDAVDAFSNAPFTIQRICELIAYPKKHYNRTDKYMRGLEKNLLVVSTVDSYGNSRNQIPVVNGRISNSTDEAYNDASNVDSDNSECSPPVNGPVLENFASVFPSATRIAAQSNNIQVPVISDTNNFLPNECVDDFNYDMNDNASVENSVSTENVPPEADVSVEDNSEITSSDISDAAFVDNSVTSDTLSVSSSDSELSNQSIESSLLPDVSSDSDTNNVSKIVEDKPSIDSSDVDCNLVSTVIDISAHLDSDKLDSDPERPADDSDPERLADDSDPEKPVDDSDPERPADDSDPERSIDDLDPERSIDDLDPERPNDDSNLEKSISDSNPERSIDDSDSGRRIDNSDLETPVDDSNLDEQKSIELLSVEACETSDSENVSSSGLNDSHNCVTSETGDPSEGKQMDTSDMDFEQEDNSEPSPKRRKLSEDKSENVILSESETEIVNEITMKVDDESDVKEIVGDVNELKNNNSETLLDEPTENKNCDIVFNTEESINSFDTVLNGDSKEINDDSVEPLNNALDNSAD